MAQLAAVAPAEPVRRFTAQQGFHDLMDGVQAVALSVTSGDSKRARHISKDRWDRQRVFLQRYDLPTAETVRQRLRKHCSWDRALEVALAPTAHRLQILNRLQSSTTTTTKASSGKAVLVIGDIGALLCARQRLKHTPSEVEYEMVANAIARERSRRREIVPSRLPSAEAIRQRHGSWQAALKAAKLPSRKSEQPITLTTPTDVLDQFIDDQGFLPTEEYFRAWARQEGVPLPGAERRKKFSLHVEEVRSLRKTRGVWMPPKALLQEDCPALTKPEPRARYSAEDRLRDLRLYGATLVPGELPGYKDYQAKRSAFDPPLMAVRHLVKGRSWQELCQEAGIDR
jgi:hypothetical protein